MCTAYIQRNNMAVGFCGMIYHDCIQKPIVLPIYVQSIPWDFLTDFLSIDPLNRHLIPPQLLKQGVSTAHTI